MMCTDNLALFKNVYEWVKLLKEGWNSIQDEDRSGRSKIASPSEMVDSGNTLILADRSLMIEDISEQLVFCIVTAHKWWPCLFEGQLLDFSTAVETVEAINQLDRE